MPNFSKFSPKSSGEQGTRLPNLTDTRATVELAPSRDHPDVLQTASDDIKKQIES